MKDFDKFRGRRVSVTEGSVDIGGRKYPTQELDDDDITISEIMAEAKVQGLKRRVWLPGMAGTCDW